MTYRKVPGYEVFKPKYLGIWIPLDGCKVLNLGSFNFSSKESEV